MTSPPVDTSALRREYGDTPFQAAGAAPSWWEQFADWFAGAASLTEPNAIVVATVGPDGTPRARTVLLKSFDADGFVWASNYASRKGRDLEGAPVAGLVFPWHELQRQVHAEGRVERVDAATSDRIWTARPRESQLSALASHQSEVVGTREEIEQRVARLAAEHPDSVPRPGHWGGYRLRPTTVEFWQGRRNRLHDRLRYRCVGDPQDVNDWLLERLEP